MENNTILVIDDDRNILAIIELYLKKAGYTVVTCDRGDAAIKAFNECAPSLVLLDVMLPGMDGWAVLSEIRRLGKTPVIMLTAKGDTQDRVQGLEGGADDYIVKPFDAKELVARIKAVLRRSVDASNGKTIEYGNLSVSLDTYEVLLDSKRVEMPPKELEVLYFLASHEGKVFTREQLLEQVWGFDYFGDSRTIDVHIKRIRERLANCRGWQIRTVWSVGYKNSNNVQNAFCENAHDISCAYTCAAYASGRYNSKHFQSAVCSRARKRAYQGGGRAMRGSRVALSRPREASRRRRTACEQRAQVRCAYSAFVY